MFRNYKSYAFPRSCEGVAYGLRPIFTGSLSAEPNYEVCPRILKDYCLVYFSKGSGFLKAGGKSFRIAGKDMFLLYPNMIHSYCTDPDNLIEMYWIGFNGTEAEKLVSQAAFTTENPVYYSVCPDAENTLRQLEKDSCGTGPAEYLKLRGGLYHLFGILISERSLNVFRENEIKNISDTVNYAQNYINTHYSEKISVSGIAKELGIARSCLTSKFREELGRSPMNYLTYVRLMQAKNLLEHTELSVAEIAFSTGYSDPLYFSKAFSQAYGISPSDCRKKAKSKEQIKKD